jgi:beta-galactosidase
VGAVPDGPLAHAWRYTTDKPPADWTSPAFDASAWKLGRGGFGQKHNWESFIQTPWSTKDIWLRQKFACDDATFRRAMLVAHYDNGTEVYVNGQPIWQGRGWNDHYAGFDVTKPLWKALRAGQNTIAIHCNQDTGGQFIDVALLVTAKEH